MHEATPQRSLKERQRHERENLILQVAEEVFAEKGYHETSMEEIATRVGIAKGTLYLHFARKEDLARALLLDKLGLITEAVEKAAVLNAPVQERLVAIMHFIYVELYGSYLRTIYMVFNSTELQSLFQQNRSQVYALVTPLIERMSALFDEAKACGACDANMPTQIMLSIFLSMLSPKAYRLLVEEGSFTADELFQCVQHAFFHGVAAT
jgi:AcrR family transcriptional regulator